MYLVKKNFLKYTIKASDFENEKVNLSLKMCTLQQPL